MGAGAGAGVDLGEFVALPPRPPPVVFVPAGELLALDFAADADVEEEAAFSASLLRASSEACLRRAASFSTFCRAPSVSDMFCL